MTVDPAPGAWGGSTERKRAVLATVSAAVAGNAHAMPSPMLYFNSDAGCPPFGNGYCLAFGTVDPAELEDRSGLPVGTLQLIGGALVSCWERSFSRTIERPYVTPVAKDGLVDALEAIRPGADPGALPARYVIALLRDLQDLVPMPDGRVDAPLPTVMRRVAQLHVDEREDRAPDAPTWAGVRREAVAATDVAVSPKARAIGAFVEAVAWPMDDLVHELPGVVEQLHGSLTIAERESRSRPEMLAVMRRANHALLAINLEAASHAELDNERRRAWMEARMAENADIRAMGTPEFEDQLIVLACAACDTHGPRAYRLLIDTLKQI